MNRHRSGSVVLVAVLLCAALGAGVLSVYRFSSSQSSRAAVRKDLVSNAARARRTAIETLSNLLNSYSIFERPNWDGSIQWFSKGNNLTLWTFDPTDGPTFGYGTCTEKALREQTAAIFDAAGGGPNLFGCTTVGDTFLLNTVRFTRVTNRFPSGSGSVPPDGRYSIDVAARNETPNRAFTGNVTVARVELPPPLPWCQLSPGFQYIPCEGSAPLNLRTAMSDKSLRVLVNGAPVPALNPNIRGGTFFFRPTALGPAPNVRAGVRNPYCGDYTFIPQRCLATACGINGCGCTRWQPEQYIPRAHRSNTITVEVKGYGVTPPWNAYNTDRCQATVVVMAPRYTPQPPPGPFVPVASPPPVPPPPPPQSPPPPDCQVGQILSFPGANVMGCINPVLQVTTCIPGACQGGNIFCNGVFHHNRGCPPLPGLGCFHPDTRLLLHDGTWKPARHVVRGDLVFNPLTAMPARVEMVLSGPEEIPLVELVAGGKRLRVTTKHPMVTPDGVVTAETLSVGDYLLGADGGFHRITLLARAPLPGTERVFNFQLGDFSPEEVSQHMLVAEGLVTGDWVLQTSLERRQRPSEPDFALQWRALATAFLGRFR